MNYDPCSLGRKYAACDQPHPRTCTQCPRYMDKYRKEGDRQAAALKAFEALGWCFWRNNMFDFGKKMKTKGRPDIIGFMPDRSGRFVGVEMKRPGETQRPDQITFQHKAEDWRAVYIVATSAEEAVDKIQKARIT